jgi:L-threonylcarbamoyladenylate synthase
MRDNQGKVARAAELIKAGRAVVYPTETLYALGANGLDHGGVRRVAALKGRAADKPLPLIIGGLDQLRLVTSWDNALLGQLAELFWPGPLSILVPARASLPHLVADGEGWTSVRQSSNEAAQALARAVKAPLVATSANRAGQPPVHRLEHLDPGLAGSVDMVLDCEPFPQGGPPSTVVRISGGRRLDLIREGAVRTSELTAHGFEVRTEKGGL